METERFFTAPLLIHSQLRIAQMLTSNPLRQKVPKTLPAQPKPQRARFHLKSLKYKGEVVVAWK